MFKAVILGTLGMWVSATLIEWVGVLGIVSVPGLEGKQMDFIVPLILQKGVSPVFASLMIAGIMAAGMLPVDAVLTVDAEGPAGAEGEAEPGPRRAAEPVRVAAAQEPLVSPEGKAQASPAERPGAGYRRNRA